MDLDAMLMADDYIKIVTKSPAGDLAAYDKNGSVSYKGAEVSVSVMMPKVVGGIKCNRHNIW